MKTQLPAGLSSAEAASRLQQHGANTLTPPPRTSLWKLYLEKYNDPIIKILLVAALLSLGLAIIEGGFVEVLGIFLAIFFSTTVGFVFEVNAQKKFDVLTAMSDDVMVRVRRDGRVMEVPRRDVVVGDIVMVEPGDEVPADGQLLTSVDLEIDESSLTGEPIAHKNAAPDDGDKATQAAYAANVVLRSTLVMAGRGTFEVTATGDDTEIGHVAKGATEPDSVPTPLNQQLSRLAKFISKIGITISILAFATSLGHDIMTNEAVWQSGDYLRMAEVVMKYFMMAVTLIVMAVPEGLPMAITLALALNMRRMLKTNNLVRKLHATETMGAVTVICTDKTGTLTENRMQVNELCLASDSTDMQLLQSAIAANTTAELNGPDGIGNPTEVALLLWLRSKGVSYSSLRESIPVIKQIPFSTERKYMATKAVVDGRCLLFVKGAPEIVMQFCDISDELRQSVAAKLSDMQGRAMRTLAFVCREIDEAASIEDSLSSMMLQAYVAIADPIRGDVPQAVRECRMAGIDVKMVTGDTRATAVEIARQIGSWDSSTPEEAHIEGRQWAALTDEEAYERVVKLRVMSRARPTDKQRMVEMLQKHGEIVAVTGDGTNDAPALNHAHIGLSLGSGTSVAKEASDMTLLDNSFASIVKAVEWGRALFRNLQRFIFFQLSVNLTALLLVLAGSFIGQDMPLTVTQILWVNLIMDTFAAIALSTLPPDGDLMSERPRDTTKFIVSPSIAKKIILWGVAMGAAAVALFYHYENAGDGNVDSYELTFFFTVFVMMQFWNLFNAKALGSNGSAFAGLLSDKAFLLMALVIVAGQWIIVTFGGEMFRTVPLSLHDWLVAIVVTFPVAILGEGIRLVRRISK